MRDAAIRWFRRVVETTGTWRVCGACCALRVLCCIFSSSTSWRFSSATAVGCMPSAACCRLHGCLLHVVCCMLSVESCLLRQPALLLRLGTPPLLRLLHRTPCRRLLVRRLRLGAPPLLLRRALLRRRGLFGPPPLRLQVGLPRAPLHSVVRARASLRVGNGASRVHAAPRRMRTRSAPDADEAGASPILLRAWKGRAQSRCRRGGRTRARRSSSATAAATHIRRLSGSSHTTLPAELLVSSTPRNSSDSAAVSDAPCTAGAPRDMKARRSTPPAPPRQRDYASGVRRVARAVSGRTAALAIDRARPAARHGRGRASEGWDGMGRVCACGSGG